MLNTDRFPLSSVLKREIIDHAQACRPNEGCGLIACHPNGMPVRFYPITNASPTPDSFTFDPAEHFAVLSDVEKRGMGVGAIVHSHPRGEAVPSRVDLAQPHDRSWYHLIVGFSPSPHIRIWRFTASGATEVGSVFMEQPG